MFSRASIARRMCQEDQRRQGADPEQFVDGVQPALKLPNRQGRAAQAARREDRGHPGAVRQPRVEQRLVLGDVVAQRAGDVADGDLEALLLDGDARRPARAGRRVR